jgi:hypothetical protein
MRWAIFALALTVSAQTIPDAGPWTLPGDPVAAMVSGMERYLDRLRAEMKPARKPSAERLRAVLGVVDPRVPVPAIETTGGESARWPVLRGVNAEGIHLTPKGTRRGCVVAVPNVDQAPEQLAAARQFAVAGYEVLSPVLLSTDAKYSGNPDVRMSKLTHREWIYRMSFPVGRHPIGYEVQKVLAAVDWFSSQNCETSVYGTGDGGATAWFAAVLDPRIAAVETENTTIEPKSLREEPAYRNLFGILRDFGDEEIRRILGSRIRRLPLGEAAAGSPPAGAVARMERHV